MRFELPKQLKSDEFRFVKLKGKVPFEKKWQTNGYKFNDTKTLAWLSLENNVGVIGGWGRLRIQDIDDKKLGDELIEKFNTFTVRTGSGGCHFYFKCEFDKNFVLKDDLGEFRANNYQVVAPNMKHPNGNFYEVIRDIPIREISEDEFMSIIKPYMRETSNEIIKTDSNNTRSEREFKEVLRLMKSGKTKEDIFNAMNDFAKWSTAHPQYRELTYNKALDIFDLKTITPQEKLTINIQKGLNKKSLAKNIMEVQPVYYDTGKNWWLWNSELFKWKIVDETDILNAVDKNAIINVINSKEKNEMLEALKQVSRLNKPEELSSDYIQFKNYLYNFKTEKKIEASSKYFATNPIPWELNMNSNEETPIMDKIFTEWVGKDHIKTLYEILAYCLIQDYPIHRIFCFIGGGMNGKSKFLELLRKFIGKENTCTTELDILLQSRFEITKLHKKLACQMGETNFNEMNKTSKLKMLSGGDLIGFEYKNKDPFEDINYAKILISTNNLPATTDKTIGFYRRWMIIDFPNQFNEKKDILKDIPEEEYHNLTLKCVKILKNLLWNREFTNEGTIEERMKRYEDHSNPLEKFLREFTIEDFNSIIWKNDFSKKLNEWCRQNRFREISDVSIGSKMKKLGINQKLRYLPWDLSKKGRCYTGIMWKNDHLEQVEQLEQAS